MSTPKMKENDLSFETMPPLTPDIAMGSFESQVSAPVRECNFTISSALHEPYYIDEVGLEPLKQFNSGTSVPFFNLCSATVGYPTSRLLKFRLNGIISIPEPPRRFMH